MASSSTAAKAFDDGQAQLLSKPVSELSEKWKLLPAFLAVSRARPWVTGGGWRTDERFVADARARAAARRVV
jgi:hypothetical protein